MTEIMITHVLSTQHPNIVKLMTSIHLRWSNGLLFRVYNTFIVRIFDGGEVLGIFLRMTLLQDKILEAKREGFKFPTRKISCFMYLSNGSVTLAAVGCCASLGTIFCRRSLLQSSHWPGRAKCCQSVCIFVFMQVSFLFFKLFLKFV